LEATNNTHTSQHSVDSVIVNNVDFGIVTEDSKKAVLLQRNIQRCIDLSQS